MTPKELENYLTNILYATINQSIMFFISVVPNEDNGLDLYIYVEGELAGIEINLSPNGSLQYYREVLTTSLCEDVIPAIVNKYCRV